MVKSLELSPSHFLISKSPSVFQSPTGFKTNFWLHSCQVCISFTTQSSHLLMGDIKKCEWKKKKKCE